MPQLYFTNAPWIPDYETYFYSKLSGLKTTNQENKGKERSNVPLLKVVPLKLTVLIPWVSTKASLRVFSKYLLMSQTLF